MPLQDCTLFELPKIADPRGNLTFIEENRHIPFPIKRVYYLYDVPGGAQRGGHAHKNLWQLIVAMSGSFTVTLDDGDQQKKVMLNRSYLGLIIGPMVWRVIDDFSSGAVSMVLASEFYDESDYFREYDEFLRAVRNQVS